MNRAQNMPPEYSVVALCFSAIVQESVLPCTGKARASENKRISTLNPVCMLLEWKLNLRFKHRCLHVNRTPKGGFQN